MRAATGQKVKKSREDIIFDVINYTFLTLFTLLCVFPFYYVLINSISANDMVGYGQGNVLSHWHSLQQLC